MTSQLHCSKKGDIRRVLTWILFFSAKIATLGTDDKNYKTEKRSNSRIHWERHSLSEYCFQDWKFVANDYTFAETVSGQPQPYGQAKDCASDVQSCHFGTMKVNLTHSGFVLHNEVDISKCKMIQYVVLLPFCVCGVLRSPISCATYGCTRICIMILMNFTSP